MGPEDSFCIRNRLAFVRFAESLAQLASPSKRANAASLQAARAGEASTEPTLAAPGLSTAGV